MKILIGQIAHETNTFSNVRTTEELFRVWEWDRGQAIIARHRHVQDYLGGMIDRAEELGIEVVPIFSAFTYPSGTITGETYELLKSELIEGIRKADPVDAICLALHGAGVADGIDDLEGELLKEVRKLVGDSLPIIVTLDLHANVTEKMVASADVLLGVKCYPHTDSFDRGKEAVDLAQQIVTGQLLPVMHLTRLPLMIPTSTTNLPPARDINQICREWERVPQIVDCTFFHGFPYADVPVVGVSVLAVANRDKKLAREAAETVAGTIWSLREGFFPQFPSPAEGLQQALMVEGQPIVINETSDNPGGGTPGDGTHLLRALLQEDLAQTCFGFIFDPEVAQTAHKAGVGAVINVKLGGKTDSLHGEPLEVQAYVKSLTDGQFIQSSPMWQGARVNLGKSARLRIDHVEVLVCSVKSQVFDEQIFLLHGIDVKKYKIVALKSSQHFRAAFESSSKKIITVDSPGLSTMNLFNFPYTRLARPIYPLDNFSGEKFGFR